MFELVLNALVLGVLLGGVYAIIAIGLSMSFGLLKIPNVAHPGFVVLGGYCAYMWNETANVDPIIASILFSPFFFFIGVLMYIAYNRAFERKAELAGAGIVFLFGVLVLIEMGIFLNFGVDLVSTYTPYTLEAITIGNLILPFRLIYPFLVGLVAVLGLYIFLNKTFLGLAAMAVAQDELAVMIMGSNPTKVKSIVFGLSLLTASIAGGLLIAAQPMDPFSGRIFISRCFAVVVLGGMGTAIGTLIAAVAIGIMECVISVLYGGVWALTVSFCVTLILLLLKPGGLLRR